MICSKCKELNLKSFVQGYGGSVTCMGFNPYYDEQGVYHYHDGNRRTFSYSCSNGHFFTVTNIAECPNCDFGKNSESINFKEVV